MMRVDSGNMNDYNNANSQVETGRKEVKQVVDKVRRQPKEVVVDVPIDGEAKKRATEHEVIQAIESANKHFKSYDRRLEFSIHDKTKQIMVKVINTEDDSIVREIPSEKILDMVAKLWEMAGIFVDEKR